MKRYVLGGGQALLLAIFFNIVTVQAGMVIVDFDDSSKWTRGSDVAAITSYSSLHTYVDQGFVFTGGPALRNTNSLVDGVPGALGSNSWRLRDSIGVNWRATYSQVAISRIATVGFSARRWGPSPSVHFQVAYSVDGGSSFFELMTLNNAALDNSSQWKTFEFQINTPVLTSDQFIVQFSSSAATERLMIDNFFITPVPEPSSILMVAIGLGSYLVRLRFYKRLCKA
jgi:hypothetical protein